MDEVGIWIVPISVIPGVGLLIMSTSVRFSNLHGEIHHVLESCNECMIKGLMARGRLLHWALFLLYISVALAALSSLVATTLGTNENTPYHFACVLALGSIVALFVASAFLVLESRKSFEVLLEHESQFNKK